MLGVAEVSRGNTPDTDWWLHCVPFHEEQDCSNTHMYIRNGLGHEGDCQDDDGRKCKEDQCKVKVVNATDDEGAVGRGPTAAISIDKLWDHPAQSS